MDLTFSPYILQLAPDADTPDQSRVSAVPVAVHNSLAWDRRQVVRMIAPVSFRRAHQVNNLLINNSK